MEIAMFEPMLHGAGLIFIGMVASFGLVLLGCSVGDALKR